MKNKARKCYTPHELASHVASALDKLPHDDLGAVRTALNYAIKELLKAEPTELDLTDPDYGIPFALAIERSEHTEKIKAAGYLLRMCLHSIERGETTENERRYIPLYLSALSGYVPDNTMRAGRKPRPNRSKEDALDRGLDDALKANPEGTWRNHVDWLEGEGIVVVWSEDKNTLTFTDGEIENTISIPTFRTRITNAKERCK